MDKQNHSSGHGNGNQSPGYETTDAHFKPIFYFTAGLLLLVAISFVSMIWLFDYLESQARAVDKAPSPLADPQGLPPEPRLQVAPGADLLRYNETVGRQLDSYEWIDQETGVVRIPVRRAMELLAERSQTAGTAEESGNN